MNDKGTSVRVAIDAMGGDLAPDEIVAGAILAQRDGLGHMILVGDEARIRRVALAPIGGVAPSSVMVFQPPLASHLPAHLDEDAPQDWQTKLLEDLAMMILFWVARPDGKPERPLFLADAPRF